MLTTSHILLGAAVFGKNGQTKRTVGALVGGLIPDATIFLMVAWSLVAGIDQQLLWREVYYSEPWHSILNAFNSAPIYAGLLLIGIWRKWSWLWALAAAALVHCGIDFLTHHDDGHAHLWPFSQFIFESPVSYWDKNHFGRQFFFFELAVTIALCVFIWFRLPSWWMRAILGLAWVGGASVFAFFKLTLGGP